MALLTNTYSRLLEWDSDRGGGFKMRLKNWKVSNGYLPWAERVAALSPMEREMVATRVMMAGRSFILRSSRRTVVPLKDIPPFIVQISIFCRQNILMSNKRLRMQLEANVK